MITRYLILRERILDGLADVRRAADKAIQAYNALQPGNPNASFYLDSTAINLHGMYSGIERIFEMVARELDGGLPSGPNWHRDLLTQLTLKVKGVRPAVIHSQTAKSLDEYLRFRHLVRNVYTWDFEMDKLADLVGRLPETLTLLETDLVNLGRFLEAASTADETGENNTAE